MGDHSAVVAPETQPRARSQNPVANYQFSSDELRVLRECNTESFFRRSLPIGTSLGLAAYFGVKQGYLTPNSKYGAVPKVVVSVIIGYFLGKFSYQRACVQKLMQLPNSKLADILRQRRRGGIYESFTSDQNIGTGFGMSPFTKSPDVYSDVDMRMEKGNSLDLDFERPSQSGLEDYLRPSLDSSSQPLDSNTFSEELKPSVTYEELRKKNREEYSKKCQNAFIKPLPPGGPTVNRSEEKPVVEENDLPKQKNLYGDVWSS